MRTTVPEKAPIRPPNPVPPAGRHLATVKSCVDLDDDHVDIAFEFGEWELPVRANPEKVHEIAHALGMTGGIDTADMAGKSCGIAVTTYGGRTSAKITEYYALEPAPEE